MLPPVRVQRGLEVLKLRQNFWVCLFRYRKGRSSLLGGGVSMDIEERLAEVERAIKADELLNGLERKSIRFTAFLLLELALLALVIWSLFHLVNFVRSAAL